MNFTERIFFTLPAKFITLDAASLGRWVQKMYKPEFAAPHYNREDLLKKKFFLSP
jgi:hypothetical protein